MKIILAILFLLIFVTIYKRYFPIYGVPCQPVRRDKDNVIVDLRDYNISDKKPLSGAINIPVAYLKRNYHEIPGKEVHVVAMNQLEKNMGIRLLRQRGFDVVSYTINDCLCSKNKLA